jgi:branched-chain amino acid transport system permease protein
VFFLLRELLAEYGSWYLIVLGTLGVVAMMRYPQGLWGLVAERWDLRFFPVQRRVAVTASGADPASPGARSPRG